MPPERRAGQQRRVLDPEQPEHIHDQIGAPFGIARSVGYGDRHQQTIGPVEAWNLDTRVIASFTAQW